MSAYSIATRGLAGRKVPQGVLVLTPMVSMLFAASEPGAWYDPSDMSTLFQDSAGTVPVTAVEQPVGLILDKSKGLVLGPELVTNGDFSNGTTGWSAYKAVISAVNGTLKVDDSLKLGDNSSAVQQLNLVAGRTYLLTFDVVSVSGAWSIGFATTDSSAGITYPSAMLSKTTTGPQRFVFTYDGTRNFLFMEADGSGIVFYDNISVKELPGNHATQATTTKRPVLKIDAGGCYYLSFDGVDDALQTSNIDFTGTDKMTVWAGVTKLSDAARASILELSAGATNLIRIEAPSFAGSPNYFFGSVGSAQGSVTASGIAAPNTSVLTGIGDIAGDVSTLRVNSIQAGSSAADQGTGTYSNSPLYIGARAGSSLYFNGRLYGLIVRGAQSTLLQIEDTELYMNKKVGIA